MTRSGTAVVAIPLADVKETMRPLPFKPLAGLPVQIQGLSVIRGVPTPVLNLRRLLGHDDARAPRRLVLVDAGGRPLALAVDEVLGVRTLDAGVTQALPPLLAGGEAFAELGELDSALLLLLRSTKLLSEEAWAALEKGPQR